MPFSDDVRSRLDADAARIIGQYPQSRSALLPLLHLVQSEEGYVSEDGIEYCASQLGLTEGLVVLLRGGHIRRLAGVTDQRMFAVCASDHDAPPPS